MNSQQKSLNYGGNDYHVIYEHGELVKFTTAMRMFGNMVEVLQIDSYERLGEVQVTEMTLHLDDLKNIVAQAELMTEQRNQEAQEELNAEVTKSIEESVRNVQKSIGLLFQRDVRGNQNRVPNRRKHMGH